MNFRYMEIYDFERMRENISFFMSLFYMSCEWYLRSRNIFVQILYIRVAPNCWFISMHLNPIGRHPLNIVGANPNPNPHHNPIRR